MYITMVEITQNNKVINYNNGLKILNYMSDLLWNKHAVICYLLEVTCAISLFYLHNSMSNLTKTYIFSYLHFKAFDFHSTFSTKIGESSANT